MATFNLYNIKYFIDFTLLDESYLKWVLLQKHAHIVHKTPQTPIFTPCGIAPQLKNFGKMLLSHYPSIWVVTSHCLPPSVY